jgi:hypothetical protein
MPERLPSLTADAATPVFGVEACVSSTTFPWNDSYRAGSVIL